MTSSPADAHSRQSHAPANPDAPVIRARTAVILGETGHKPGGGCQGLCCAETACSSEPCPLEE
jgi:hypothetical protein